MSDVQPLTIRLSAADNVVVARVNMLPGAPIGVDGIACQGQVPRGHKIATQRIAAGEPIRKYNQIIGFATTDIAPGDHVHVHNVEMHDFARDYAYGADVKPVDYVPEGERATFMGFKRANGKVGTRNYIGILSSVNCSATVSRYIAAEFEKPGALDAFPNVDGIVAITHSTGCGMADSGEGYANLQRTLWGYARNPNFAGVLLVGLGCEVNQIDFLLEAYGIERGPMFQTMNIQGLGGTRRTIEFCRQRVLEMLPLANEFTRTEQPASELLVALQCGGSDGYSGISANPALGAAVDTLVRHGGTAVLSETPEVYGAEHLLTRRAVSRKVGEKLVERIHWWEEYTARNGGEMNNNPSPGNKAGGLTTILEKSLGATAKGGTTNLVEVYKYAEPITAKGFVFMDTPGYDPASATGQVAGGANVVCFTTGRGSVSGFKPAPCIKLATNTTMYDHMEEDMDINCGTVADGLETVEQAGERIFRKILEVASGTPTKSEAQGFGDNEFVPWQIGAVM
ncbi:galactarate dehydratase [Skermanella stibiiresistens SB22]|uniref:Galactarate dehydratase n=1 Tax=Skermanella stibiiresistens SB22 TaxID=1385369 RepID=W9GSS2_9PROT|nr:altronate dehydratase family protein [Skermanella stibiiresistens]EWY36804.1 galactarate dehydratase [Skermanella stibiiresistens SB22]